jgi:hypothetical protein
MRPEVQIVDVRVTNLLAGRRKLFEVLTKRRVFVGDSDMKLTARRVLHTALGSARIDPLSVPMGKGKPHPECSIGGASGRGQGRHV